MKDELKLNMVRLSEREGKLEDLEDKVETLNFIKKITFGLKCIIRNQF